MPKVASRRWMRKKDGWYGHKETVVMARRAVRYTICVDFDGVIHRYTSPWIKPHVIPDPPVEGAIVWIFEMLRHFTVVIFSTRCRTWRGRRAMRHWLRHYAQLEGMYWGNHLNDLEDIEFSYTKVQALIYLDDRAVRFEGPGTFPTKNAIHRQYIPWNKSAPPQGEIL